LLYESATEENKEKERVQAKRKEFKQKLSRKRAESLQYPPTKPRTPDEVEASRKCSPSSWA
jgi:hypothetical protein